MHAILSYIGNRLTHIQTHTHRPDRLQYTALQLASTQCNNTAQNSLHWLPWIPLTGHWPTQVNLKKKSVQAFVYVCKVNVTYEVLRCTLGTW